jgi:FkbM family methyltransferase
MARLVGPTGTVCTFEPHPQIFKACEENIRLNGFTNVKLLNLALGNKQGRLPFTLGHHDGAGHVTQSLSETGTITVECDSMDRLVAEGKIPPPAFVKIDVEGFESEVLEGARATVARHRPILAVDLHNPEADRRVGRFLIDQGYVAFRQQSFEPVRDLRHGWPLPDGVHGSILAVPREKVRKYPWLPIIG